LGATVVRVHVTHHDHRGVVLVDTFDGCREFGRVLEPFVMFNERGQVHGHEAERLRPFDGLHHRDHRLTTVLGTDLPTDVLALTGGLHLVGSVHDVRTR